MKGTKYEAKMKDESSKDFYDYIEEKVDELYKRKGW